MNSLYTRLLATHHSAEIKREVPGWRLYLLDASGVRVPGVVVGGIARSTSETVEDINGRLKGKGFHRDSKLFQALTVVVEYCEELAAVSAALAPKGVK